MENQENDPWPEETEDAAGNGLWLTDRLMMHLQSAARPGQLLMIICLGLASLAGLVTCYMYWSLVKDQPGDFYLLQAGNRALGWEFGSIIIILFLFIRAVLEGYRAWRLLHWSATDDNALLEGSERMSKMFRWLTLWAGFYLFSSLVGRFIKYF